jgi:hydroxyacylglutathione hydrolase
MIKIKKFVFNPFEENTYLIEDKNGECAIIDAGCYEESEQMQVSGHLEEQALKLVRNFSTHLHIDHIFGNGFLADRYGVFPEYHEAAVPFLTTVKEIAGSFGLVMNGQPKPARYLTEGDVLTFGTTQLEVFYTPGHANGHVCFYSRAGGFVFTGDVLFRDTIGRTDLPTGNFNLLMESIREKLFTLPDETVVYPGHGPETTIGYEKLNNPFIR